MAFFQLYFIPIEMIPFVLIKLKKFQKEDSGNNKMKIFKWM